MKLKFVYLGRVAVSVVPPASNRKCFIEIFNVENMTTPASKGLHRCGTNVQEFEGREDDCVDDHWRVAIGP